MELALTRIGNSQGVILPKKLITQYGFGQRINLEPREGGLFISRATPPKHPREGWAEQIQNAIAIHGSGILEPEDPEWLEVWEDDMTDWKPTDS